MEIPLKIQELARDLNEMIMEGKIINNNIVRENITNYIAKWSERIKVVDLIETNKHEPHCTDCGTQKDLTYDVCPYGSDIRGDETKLLLCDQCRYERAQDI